MKLLKSLAVTYLASAVLAQEQQLSCDLDAALDPNSPCTLEDLSNEMLEQCCLARGFELAQQDGVTFSHAEYVEAAKQCLELEAELNKLLEENPELLAELEAEQAAAAAGGGMPVVEDDVSVGGEIVVEEVVVEEAAEVEVEAAASSTEAPPTEQPEVMDLDVEVEAGANTEGEGLAQASVDAEAQAQAESGAEVEVEVEPSPGNPDKSNLLNPAGLSMSELWSGFKDKVTSDVNMVCDKVIPAPLRGPVKGAVKKAMKVTKSLINTGVKTARRTVMTFIDEKRAQMGAEKEVEVEAGRVGL
ncbi:hypothetical protein TrRE_jg10505 [Triparma retinervis]|uniref:Uncharacterized protein n=1 Tax=Triparma retinervis TaxID=2557542 RepID=A0A9W7ECQ9_9STRA|nr:hypothetical protein TrRE_jg10505 [Triparma retinervis]